MGKDAYIGINGIAKEIKKAYIGIDGVARKIKKAYIGVNGVARLCYSAWNGELFSSDGQFEEITGGWVADNKPYVYFQDQPGIYLGGGVMPTLDTSGSTMIMTVSGGQYASGSIYTRNKIDLTDYKTITINGSFAISGSSIGFYNKLYITDSISSSIHYNYLPNGVQLEDDGDTVLDISGVTGSFYVCVGLYITNDSTHSYEISSIVLGK